ncbi:MAG: LysR family transcriptional regulator [Deltaproteobacteria bacterium]|nr:LysR family transcriptional regulator [Myxococcales bacterium]MDP3218186.1 LysR family transcriptional regulator [Deltaproteobacteria bacterium]
MSDPFTLDQLRALIAVAEAGSFSAAARRLQRVQSAVSTSMANLESQLGVALWDRSTRVPQLTEQGRAVLAGAQRVCAEVDTLRRLSAGLAGGLEASVSLCVDQLFPIAPLVELCQDFAREFPSVDLRVDTQTLSAVSARVVDGRATLGVVSPLGLVPGLERHHLARIRMVAVAAPRHPLARRRGRIPTAALADSVQIVLSERDDAGVADQAVLSPRTWRIADLPTKHAMLVAGLGWGNLPEHLIRDDLARKRLVVIRPQAWGDGEHTLHLSAVHRADAPFGAAHRWVLAQLQQLCARDDARAPRRAKRPAG